MSNDPFDVERLLDGPWPVDVTLGEVRLALPLQPKIRPFAAYVAGRGLVLRVRFLRKPEGTELPDATTIGEFSALANAGRAQIVLDGDGGLPAATPVPELVS